MALEPIAAIREYVDCERVATGINVYEAGEDLSRQLRQQDRVLCQCDGTMSAVFACMGRVWVDRNITLHPDRYSLTLGENDPQPATVPPTAPPFSKETAGYRGHDLGKISRLCVERANERLIQISRGK